MMSFTGEGGVSYESTAVKVERGSERTNIKAAFLHQQKWIYLRTANSPQIDLNEVMAIKLT